MKTIKEIAKELHLAARETTAIPQWSETQISDLDMAYQIQRELIKMREKEGHSIVGIKMGFTSFAKMEQMGVHDMIWGILTQDMVLTKDEKLCLDSFIHPRAEPEICFKVGKTIDRELTIEEAKNSYISNICGAIEIIDSRYKNFKFSLADVIADNCSSAAFILGEWLPVDTSLKDLHISLKFNDQVKAEGSSNDILGDPWLSVVHASRLAHQYGHKIQEGDIILAGAATSAVFLDREIKVSANIQGMDSIDFETE